MKFTNALATSAVLLPFAAHCSDVTPQKIDWDYKQQGADWQGVCASGKRQSPVSFNETDANEGPFPFTYHQNGRLQTVSIENDGTTLRVRTTDVGHKLQYANQEYELKNYHFHCPGEHIINGRRPDLVMHMEHAVGEGNSAKKVVLALPWYAKDANDTSATPGNEFLADVMKEKFVVDQYTTRSCATGEEPCLDPRWVLNDMNTTDSWIQYEGSDTMPSCTQNVMWFIDTSVRYVNSTQLDWFKSKLVYEGTKGNYRELPNRHDSLTLTRANATMVEYPDAAFSARGVSLMSFAVAGVVAIYTAGMHV